MAKRSYPASEARGDSREEIPGVRRGQGRRPGGATPHPRPGAVPEARGGCREEEPHAQGVVAVRAQEVLEESSHFEGQERQQEEIRLIQDKEQRLCFSGAALKRYSMPKVRETQARW